MQARPPDRVLWEAAPAWRAPAWEAAKLGRLFEGGLLESFLHLVDTQPLWWPPAKIVGRYLSPFLAQQLGLTRALAEPPQDALEVEVALDTADHASWMPA